MTNCNRKRDFIRLPKPTKKIPLFYLDILKIVILSALVPHDRLVVMEIIKNFSNVTLVHLLSASKREKGISAGTQVNKLGKKILRKLSNLRIDRHF